MLKEEQIKVIKEIAEEELLLLLDTIQYRVCLDLIDTGFDLPDVWSLTEEQRKEIQEIATDYIRAFAIKELKEGG